PINYIRFMSLVFSCRFVITDSGGIQEETTHLGIPCLTMRPNTERPVTITRGTNQLCTVAELEEKAGQILSGRMSKADIIENWDGKTAIRIREIIKNVHGSQLTVSS
ncbi:MAG: UDP-N-acetylglucosamine 2-epimerase, partial [Pseudomonadota bacterium]